MSTECIKRLVVALGIAIQACSLSCEDEGPVEAPNPIPRDPDRLPAFVNEWSTLTAPADSFNAPGTSCVGHNGNLLVIRSLARPIREYSPSGHLVGQWFITDGPDTLRAVQLEYSRGNYYAAASGSLFVYDDSRELTLSWKLPIVGVSVPFVSFDVDRFGNIYWLEFQSERVIKYSAAGELLTQWNTHGSNPTGHNWPGGIAVSSSGLVFVSDTLHDRILKFDSDGEFLGEWGAKGSGPGEFRRPHDLAFDDQGYLYVVDSINERIQKFNIAGGFLGEFSSKIIRIGENPSPGGIAIDASNVFVIHSQVHTIRRFSFE